MDRLHFFQPYLRYCIIIPAFYLLLISCDRLEVYTDCDTEIVKKKLTNYQYNSVSVDSVTEKKGLFQFCFSDNTEIGFDSSKTALLTIDAMGFWRLNGEKLKESLEVPGYDIFHSIETCDDCDEIVGILEGYTEWSFYFKDGATFTLKKTLFISDPDLVVRGINHRGYSKDAPENTLPAFRLSKLMGFKFVETDVYFTSDGVPVLLHDGTVDRTSNGTGAIEEMEWSSVRSLDFGAWKNAEFAGTTIPSLEEFLLLCQQIDLWPYIELKTGNKKQVGIIVSMVEEYGLKGKAVYISFSSTLLQCVQEFDSTATLGYLLSSVTEKSIQTALDLKFESNTVFINTSDSSGKAVSLCRDACLPMEIWTINNQAAIVSMDKYITGVTSDYLHAGRILHSKGR